jgi:hypothetical protein
MLSGEAIAQAVQISVENRTILCKLQHRFSWIVSEFGP